MSEQSIEFVKGVYGAFARGDVPAVLGAFADDIEWYEAVCTTAARPSRRRSLARSLRTSKASRSYPRSSWDPVKPSPAVVRYTGTGKATGKALDLPVVHIWDIRDGKLARFRQFIDTVKFAEVVPVPAAV